MDAGLGLTAPLITIGLLHFGWRSTFVGLGFAGLLWAAVWYLWYRDDPAQHRGVNAGELAIMGEAAARQQGNAVQWTEVVASPNLWAILLMYLTYGYTGYIYVTWFPTYLIEARHVSTGLAGILAAMPGLLGLVTKPLGGWMSDRLTQRYGLTFGRRSVGILGFGVAALAVLPGLYVNSNYWSAFFLAIASAAAALAHGVCFAVCIDIGRRRACTISGLMLTCGCVGNAASAFAFGFFLQFTGSWTAPFLIGMCANLTGALLWLKIHPEEQIA
jgi:nitrate/nitrite transporter NarK